MEIYIILQQDYKGWKSGAVLCCEEWKAKELIDANIAIMAQKDNPEQSEKVEAYIENEKGIAKRALKK